MDDDNIDKDNGSDDDSKSIVKQIDFEQYVSKMVSIRKTALENTGITQQQVMAYYDSKHCKDKNHEAGALVLLENSKKFSRKG